MIHARAGSLRAPTGVCAAPVRPASGGSRTLGNAGRSPDGDRAGAALFYITPPSGWQTMWRTLAKPWRMLPAPARAVTVNSAENLGA
ncbi:hypothetical protein GCM10023347_21930 [Streptomyces chumphonensis]